jgi:GMP synthase-like glutamine amidotransferase
MTVLGLIGVSAGISMISPFLLRAVLDKAIPERDTALLTWLVAGMVAIAIATGALGVVQTWLSNAVGQRVMHDLRAAVYRHLQRLSLAFFTRTRTGEVQSRIANDIGGVQNVVTSTATSIVSSVTTVLATVVAMFALDWRLAAFSLALLPFFVWLTRRVGRERKRITAERQGRLADMSSLVEESLSVSGILLGKTMGRAPELADRFTRESADLADLEVRTRMAGRWRMASVQMTFSIMPALVYWFAGYSIAQGGAAISLGTVVAFTTLQTRLFFPLQSLLSVGIDVQTSLALFHRIFEYLDLPVDIIEREDAVALGIVRGELRFEGVSFGYDADGPPTLDGIDLAVAAGTTTAIVGETGSGKTTLGYLAGQQRRARLPGDLPLPRERAREPALRQARRYGRRAGGGGARGADPRPDRLAARWLRHGRRRARLSVLGRREAAHRHRPHGPAQPAGARPRRGDQRTGQRDRARGAGGPRPAGRGPDDAGHRPSPVDDPRRRRDRRHRSRAHRRARDARAAAGARWALRDAGRARRRARARLTALASRLIIVEQQPDAPAGLVGEWAAARGAPVELLRAPEVEAWPDPRDARAVVALGSGRSVHASPDPWIAAQVEFLRAAHGAGVPVLGICFGGQALAAALGGTVSAAPRTEIGWIDVEGEDGYGGRWFAWHEDEFTLPPGTRALARAPSGLHAFAAGASVGLQYHPEVTPAIIDAWLATVGRTVADPERLRRETAREAPDARSRAFALFDRIAARWPR